MNDSNTLVIPIAKTTDGIAIKFLPETIPLLNIESFEGFLNWCKIDRIVNDNSSSCN